MVQAQWSTNHMMQCANQSEWASNKATFWHAHHNTVLFTSQVLQQGMQDWQTK
jgi:hypothetical protein